MKHSIKILFSTAIILGLSLFVYSCIKGNDSEARKAPSMELIKERMIAKGYQVIASDRSLPFSCTPPPPPPGSDCITFHNTDVISVPAVGGNPACDIVTIEYDVSWCISPDGTVTSSLINFRAIPSQSCSALWDYWANLDGFALDQALNSFMYRASLVAETRALDEFLKTNNLFCPEYHAQSSFVTDLCFQYCLTVNVPNTVPSISKISCGQKCCIRQREACLNADGTIEFSSPKFIETGSTCKANPILEGCSGKVTGICEHACGVQ